jgi:hypothetical protein
MKQRSNRIQLTISEKYPQMFEIIDDLKSKGLSVSDYLCKLAIKDYYSSKDTKRPIGESDLDLPSIDKIIDYMLDKKMNIANEVIRLLNRKEITAERVIKTLGSEHLRFNSEKLKL